MARVITFLILIVVVSGTGCRPTYEDWSRDWKAVFQGYMTGEVHTAKAALLEEEKLIAKHEARGNRGVDFVAVRTVLYSHLCGISAYMGQTNDARLYYEKYLAVSPQNTKTYVEVLEGDRKADELLKPKWREEKSGSPTNQMQ